MRSAALIILASQATLGVAFLVFCISCPWGQWRRKEYSASDRSSWAIAAFCTAVGVGVLPGMWLAIFGVIQ